MATTPRLIAARHWLDLWGIWWNVEAVKHVQGRGISNLESMREILRLEVRVQKTNTRAHHERSEAIRCPDWVAVISDIVESLSPSRKAAIRARYRGRDLRQHTALLRAEVLVGDLLPAEFVAQWAYQDRRQIRGYRPAAASAQI